MNVERGLLWAAALAVFAALNPFAGLDGRIWQEVVLLYGGLILSVLALSGATPLSAVFVWCVVLLAWKGGGPVVVLYLLAWLGVYALARRHGAASLLRVIVAVNVAVMALQVIGVWEWVLRQIVPSASVTVYNAVHPVTGLTSSSGDVACVLAVALPFCFTAGRAWAAVGALGILGLFHVQALSGLVAGLAGLTVAALPWLRRQKTQDWWIGYAALGLLGAVVLYENSELRLAITDERWAVWAAATERMIASGLIFGSGLGSWTRDSMTVVDMASGQARVWSQMHFDLLQFTYDAGLVGAALVVAAWAWLARAAHRKGVFCTLGALVAIAVCQFGHFPFYLASAGTVFALVAGEAVHE